MVYELWEMFYVIVLSMLVMTAAMTVVILILGALCWSVLVAIGLVDRRLRPW